MTPLEAPLQPIIFSFVFCFKSVELVIVFPRHAVIVKTIQHSVFIERIDFEDVPLTVRPAKTVCASKIKCDFRTRFVM